jgi:hypothetical protein
MQLTFGCFGNRVDSFRFASQIFPGTVNPNVHHLYFVLRLRDGHIMLESSFVEERVGYRHLAVFLVYSSANNKNYDRIVAQLLG